MDIEDNWKHYKAIKITGSTSLKETRTAEAAYYYGVFVCAKIFVGLLEKHGCIDRIIPMEADINAIIKSVEIYVAKDDKT